MTSTGKGKITIELDPADDREGLATSAKRSKLVQELVDNGFDIWLKKTITIYKEKEVCGVMISTIGEIVGGHNYRPVWKKSSAYKGIKEVIIKHTGQKVKEVVAIV